MSSPRNTRGQPSPPPRRRPPAAFRPSFTLSILYFAGLFIAFAMILILPEMLDALGTLPPDVDAEQAGAEVAQRIAGPRLLGAFLLAAMTLIVGAYYQVLPGMRRP